MFVESRADARRHFLRIWAKRVAADALDPLETIVAQIIEQHPEYHALLANPEAVLAHEAAAGSGIDNPFLHMSLHVALVEQLHTDRPPGILALYRQLIERGGDDTHAVEHRIMECLASALAAAAHAGTMPDESAYLECVRRRLG